MKFNPRIFIPFIGLCFVGCSHIPSELKTAEKLMDTSPDSSLILLKQVQPNKLLTNSDQALYGLLLFQALDKTKQALEPDSVINFSINYYEKTKNKERLASCYFYKGRMYNNAQKFDEATVLYLKALDYGKGTNNYDLLAKIYGDMGNICSLQREYIDSRNKYLLAVKYFNKLHNLTDACYRMLDIARTYYAEKNYVLAKNYILKVLNSSNDSILNGFALQELGTNFYFSKQYDSSELYIRKSLKFPYIDTDYSTRCYMLANINFNIEKYDTAFYYASTAINYPCSFYTQRECYRILANTCYLKKDLKQMGKYMTCYQSCTDSVQRMESQTKATVIETIYKNKQENKHIKVQWFWIILILFTFLIFGLLTGHLLFKRYKAKKIQLEIYKLELISKQAYLSKNLEQKIEETKEIQTQTRKLTNITERNKISKALYTNCLHLNNWELFSTEMNQAFNQIVEKLEHDCPQITRKEVMYCCLCLLNLPAADKIIILETTADGLYKLKQRLAKKLKLLSTKALDLYLKQYAN